MKFLYAIVVCLFCFVACDSGTSPIKTLPLEEIYQLESQDKLEEYLSRWSSNHKQISQNEFNSLSQIEKDVYEIYEEFYNPFNMDKYCTLGRCPEFGSNIYKNAEYLIIQNEIHYNHIDMEEVSTIKNFSPRIIFDSNLLYLTEHYKNELDSFLDTEVNKDDIQKRQQFLNEKLSIWPGHWFGWHYVTHPEVSTIQFNNSLDSAIVHFRIIFEGGEAKFVKNGNKWKMTESYLTWIE